VSAQNHIKVEVFLISILINSIAFTGLQSSNYIYVILPQVSTRFFLYKPTDISNVSFTFFPVFFQNEDFKPSCSLDFLTAALALPAPMPNGVDSVSRYVERSISGDESNYDKRTLGAEDEDADLSGESGDASDNPGSLEGSGTSTMGKYSGNNEEKIMTPTPTTPQTDTGTQGQTRGMTTSAATNADASGSSIFVTECTFDQHDLKIFSASVLRVTQLMSNSRSQRKTTERLPILRPN